MPRAKQLTVSAPDRPGLMGELASALGAKKVNIRAFHAWAMEGRGIIRLVVDKLREWGLNVTYHELAGFGHAYPPGENTAILDWFERLKGST